MIGGSGGGWSGKDGVKGVETKGGAVDDDGGVSGGLTQNGALVSPAARLSASAPAVGGCRRRAGSTVRMKLSLKSASSSGLLLLLCSRLLLMALASAPSMSMHEQTRLLLLNQNGITMIEQNHIDHWPLAS